MTCSRAGGRAGRMGVAAVAFALAWAAAGRIRAQCPADLPAACAVEREADGVCVVTGPGCCSGEETCNRCANGRWGCAIGQVCVDDGWAEECVAEQADVRDPGATSDFGGCRAAGPGRSSPPLAPLLGLLGLLGLHAARRRSSRWRRRVRLAVAAAALTAFAPATSFAQLAPSSGVARSDEVLEGEIPRPAVGSSTDVSEPLTSAPWLGSEPHHSGTSVEVGLVAAVGPGADETAFGLAFGISIGLFPVYRQQLFAALEIGALALVSPRNLSVATSGGFEDQTFPVFVASYPICAVARLRLDAQELRFRLGGAPTLVRSVESSGELHVGGSAVTGAAWVIGGASAGVHPALGLDLLVGAKGPAFLFSARLVGWVL